MIQRIQTIYLALAVIVSSTLTYVNIADYVTKTGIYVLKMRGVFNSLDWAEAAILENNIYTLLITLSIIIPLYTIFCFKKRKLQMKLTLASIVINLFTFGWTFAITNFAREYIDFKTSYSIFLIFPLISAILLVLAYVNINKDEKLIKSLNRIR